MPTPHGLEQMQLIGWNKLVHMIMNALVFLFRYVMWPMHIA